MLYTAHFGSHVDGPMAIALNIARGFSLAKIPSIFIINGPPDIFRKFEETGVDVRKIEMPKPGVAKHFNPFYRRRFSKKLIELIDTEGIDVLHVAQREAYIFNYVKGSGILKVTQQDAGMPDAKLMGIFDKGVSVNPKKVLKKWYRKYVLWNYKRADLVLCLSNAAREFAIKVCRTRSELAVVVRPGVTRRLDDAKPGDVRREFGVKPDEKIVLSVGRITKSKGVEDVGEIAKILSERGKNIKFFFAGPARDEAYYQWVKQKYGRYVTFIGHRHDIYNAYADANLFTHLSHREGLGMVIAEALEFGLPCVGWDIPGINEAFCDGVSGRSVRFGDRLAVADLIQELLEDRDELDRLVRGATERFKAYSIEGYADRILDAYAKRQRVIQNS
ncbi:MAG: glycosyltransferase family 4 protein [Chloroflexota bacterium]|nr:glycosyltransferase family 4 protein [Chloroflexota bacterium]